jgi:hypothetical protein
MAQVHGKGSYFALGATVNLTSYCDSISWTQDIDMADGSTMGKNAKVYITGLSDFTINITGKYDSTASTGPDAYIAGILASATTTAFFLGPEGNASGKVKYQGNCFVKTYKITAPIGDIVGFTADFQASDTVTRGVF